MKGRLITLIAACTFAGCTPVEDRYRVVGELASERIELSAEFNEPIVEIVVAQGASVVSGQVLLRQNDARAAVRLADAQALYLQATARLDELLRGPRSEKITAANATVEGASRELGFRQSEFSRIREIHERGLTSADTLDKAHAARDAAQATLKHTNARLEELLAGTTREQLAQAEQAVNRAAAARDAAQIDVNRHVLTAPLDGVVDSRLFETGERPGSGQPVLILLGGQQPHARVYIPELLRVRIAPGMKARIYVDGLNTPIAGQLRWVASEPAFTPYFALTERDRGRLSFVAKVDIVEQRDRLPDGLPVEVEFEFD